MWTVFQKRLFLIKREELGVSDSHRVNWVIKKKSIPKCLIMKHLSFVPEPKFRVNCSKYLFS